MDSTENLRFHIITFRLAGLWPSEGGSLIYDIWAYVLNIVVCIGYPLFQLICVLYVASIAEIADHMAITISVINASVKALILRMKKRKSDELLKLMRKIDLQVTSSDAMEIMTKISKESAYLKYIFMLSYLNCCLCVALQVIFSPPDKRLWSSTYFYPTEYVFMHKPMVYVGVLVFQVVGNFITCYLDAALDTYPPTLLHILGGHIDVLGLRIQELGHDRKQRSSHNENNKKLINICKDFVIILK